MSQPNANEPSSARPTGVGRVHVPESLVQLIQGRLGVDRLEAERLGRVVLRRRPVAFWLPALAALAVFVVWLRLAIPNLDPVEDRITGMLGRTAGMLFFTLLYCAAVALAVIAYGLIQRSLLLVPTRRELDLPACLQCGYDLRGIDATDGALHCPECAGATPVWRRTDTPAP